MGAPTRNGGRVVTTFLHALFAFAVIAAVLVAANGGDLAAFAALIEGLR